MKKRYPILVEHGVVTLIARKLGYSINTSSKALRAETIGEISDEIRRVAIEEYNGIELRPRRKRNVDN